MTKKHLRRAARILDDYATELAASHTTGADGVSWDPEFKEARNDCEEMRALAMILRQGARETIT